MENMSIPFLVTNEQDILETEHQVDINTNKHCMNADVHQHHTSIVTPGISHSRDRSGRVGRRVAYQAPMLGTNFNSGYAVNGKEDILRDQGKSPWGQLAE